jgi:hypothetical protein
MDNQEKLAKALGVIVNAFWTSNKKPILLSSIPPELEKKITDANYKDFLEGKSIKQFIKLTEAKFEYKLIEHPTQKAKIGLVPSTADYNFPTISAESEKKPSDAGSKTKNEGIALIKILSKLSDEDLEKITIPVSVIVKLFK